MQPAAACSGSRHVRVDLGQPRVTLGQESASASLEPAASGSAPLQCSSSSGLGDAANSTHTHRASVSSFGVQGACGCHQHQVDNRQSSAPPDRRYFTRQVEESYGRYSDKDSASRASTATGGWTTDRRYFSRQIDASQGRYAVVRSREGAALSSDSALLCCLDLCGHQRVGSASASC